MFKRVDVDEGNIEGFSYLNRWDELEVVKLGGDVVRIKVDGHNELPIFLSDIPKLIKALQAAYEHKTGEKL